jgi:hypothetical protein
LIAVVVALVLAHVFLLLSCCWFIFPLNRFGGIHASGKQIALNPKKHGYANEQEKEGACYI